MLTQQSKQSPQVLLTCHWSGERFAALAVCRSVVPSYSDGVGWADLASGLLSIEDERPDSFLFALDEHGWRRIDDDTASVQAAMRDAGAGLNRQGVAVFGPGDFVFV